MVKPPVKVTVNLLVRTVVRVKKEEENVPGRILDVQKVQEKIPDENVLPKIPVVTKLMVKNVVKNVVKEVREVKDKPPVKDMVKAKLLVDPQTWTGVTRLRTGIERGSGSETKDGKNGSTMTIGRKISAPSRLAVRLVTVWSTWPLTVLSSLHPQTTTPWQRRPSTKD